MRGGDEEEKDRRTRGLAEAVGRSGRIWATSTMLEGAFKLPSIIPAKTVSRIALRFNTL
jgi:hypothetical protein